MFLLWNLRVCLKIVCMKLNIYEKQLVESVGRLFPASDTASLVETLIRMGVVDTTRCKVLVVREHVHELVKEGFGKVDAMYAAAERFCCSYEYVRKCMYYYRDVNLN